MIQKNTKILFISHTSVAHSVNRCLLYLIDGLSEKGIKCYVVLPTQGLMVEELKNRNIKFSIIPIKTWASTDKILLRRILRAGFDLCMSLAIAIKAYLWEIDIIYTNSSVIPAGAFAAFLIGKPHIWHIREFGKEHYGLLFNFGESTSIKLINKLSSCIVVISEALRRKYSRYVPASKLKVIYDAVPAESEVFNNPKFRYSLENSAVPTLAIIALVHAGKGQMDAVMAIADLANQGIQVKLKIVGDAPVIEYSKQLEQVIIQNKIVENVEFTGWISDMGSLYNSTDIILTCSRWEGFGLATIEAMLFKRPVIGARSGATPELVREGFNGLLYEPGNHQELAEKIKYLINHPKEARQMGDNGFREASQKYTIEKCVNEVYKTIMGVVK
jgi:glycosyltransferase involved in cell wall biosynthesis